MRFLVAVLLILAVAQQAFAGMLYERKIVPKDWFMGAPAPLNAPAQFMIALKQQNLDQLDAKFWAVSNPESLDYQNFLTTDEILRMVAPAPEATADVMSWLSSHGVDSSDIKNFVDAIEVTTTVSRAQSLFHAKFFTFTHKSGKTVHKAFGAYSVPDSVHKHISFVEGLSSFPMPRFAAHKAVQTPNQNQEIVVPQFLQAQYQIPTLTTASTTTTHAVIEYEGEYFANNDTTQFNTDTQWNDPLIATSNIVGSNDPTQPGTESSLDVQWQAAANPTATPWFWIEGGTTWVYGFSVHFLNTTTVPQVTSTSYGWWEGDQCDIDADGCSSLGVDSTGYVERTNTEFQKIATAGVSMLISSGDSGANGRTNGDCSIPQLRPAFPASSPYVTAVGATEIRNQVFNLTKPPTICTGQGFSCVGGGLEAAVSVDNSGFTSGGGFSNISTQPSYQSAAVAAYFASGVKFPPSSYYNAAGRGIPDVAAVGQNAYIIQGGSAEVVGGTSMSSPIFSGVISLLNAASISISGKPLGFLNPILYQIAASNPAAFHDITVGDNICTEDGCSAGCQGFYAAKGWDPVTGLGTPNYAEMLTSVQSIVARSVARKAAAATAQ